MISVGWEVVEVGAFCLDQRDHVYYENPQGFKAQPDRLPYKYLYKFSLWSFTQNEAKLQKKNWPVV